MADQLGVTRARQDRDLVSSFFISMLVALAFKEMVSPVRTSIEASGITLSTSLLFFIFFFNAIRFTIGNQLHLLSLGELSGGVWLYDFLFVFAESFAFVFLGGVCTLEANARAHIGFVAILVFVLTIDVVWVFSQWMLGTIIKSWTRSSIPWGWALCNTSFLVLLAPLWCKGIDPYSTEYLVGLLVLSIAVSVIDIILVDEPNLMK